jgi:hypothetical protein
MDAALKTGFQCIIMTDEQQRCVSALTLFL